MDPRVGFGYKILAAGFDTELEVFRVRPRTISHGPVANDVKCVNLGSFLSRWRAGPGIPRLGEALVRAHILLVEDDAALRRVLQIRLTRAGYAVLEARDGREAMRLWQAQGADLVITDLYMPDKDGLEVIKEVRVQSPSTPIIAITDPRPKGRMDLRESAELMGAVRTLSKPFSLDTMLAAVEAALTASP
jgi:CheY-like chemotaxis protein